MTSMEFTGKTIEDAVEIALVELKLPADRIQYDIIEAPSKGLFGFIGNKLARIRVTVKKMDPVEVAQEFLNNVFKAMHVEVMIEKSDTPEGVTLNIRGEDLGVLIGKHGQTLDALQYLTNLAANHEVEERVRIILDVEDYRKRRTETLTRLALRLADKVKRQGERVVLEPMSPHERKIIHMALQDEGTVSTFSEGEEPYRKVVIALKR